MSAVKDNLLNIEKNRLQLEDNVKQLRKALQHWQTWDAEYEALKEEVEKVPEDSPTADLQRVRNEFEGELLIGKEADEIFGLQDQRPRNQILNVLQRRIEYVGKNVETLQKQLDAAEDKFAEATVSEATDEDGQPITEIVEQLDDDDNVVSYSLNRPGDSLPKVQEALQKAGIDELPVQESVSKEITAEKKASQHENYGLSLRPKSGSSNQAEDTPLSPIALPSAKKSVSFSEEVDSAESSRGEISRRARRVDQIMKSAKQQARISNQPPTIPDHEDDDDAELRRQMLKYSMGEVGAVVAELQLEEDGSDGDDSGFEYGDDDFDDDLGFDDDDEDGYGRTTTRMISDDYKRRMLELEKKLGIKSRFTESAKEEEEGDSEVETEGMGRIVVKRGAETTPSTSTPPPSKSSIKAKVAGDAELKKGVRFAQALDIAPEDEPAVQTKTQIELPQVEPLGDIVERTGSAKTTESKAARKQSRFKKARTEPEAGGGIPKGPFDVTSQMTHHETRTVPTGPDGRTLAEQLVERGPSSNVVAPDEFDDSLVHQEVADEHHRLRKKFIQRHGGFLKDDESPIQPLDEADGGERVSRFKAARLSRQ